MNRVAFHTQLASIMEVLANAAVAEICKLVDDGYSVLRFQVCQTQKENRALKRRIQMMEPRAGRDYADSRADKFGDGGAENLGSNEGRISGRQQWRKGDPEEAEDVTAQPAPTEQSADMEEEAGAESVLIKEERLEEEELESQNRHRGLDVSEEKAKSRMVDEDQDSIMNVASPKASKGTEEFTEHHRSRPCVSEVSGLETVLKAEPERASGSQGLQHAGSEHCTGRLNRVYSDYTVYSKHSQLRTFFAQGVEETDTDVPSCSYATEMDSESLSFHSELQPISTTEEDVGDSVSLGSADVKPELVMVDSAPDGVETEICSAWDSDALPSAAAFTPRSRNRGEGRKARKQRESMFDVCPSRVQMAASEGTVESNSHAIDMNGYVPCEPNLITPRDIKTQSRIGTREKLFICTICGKAFNRPKKVEIHLRVHTGEKPFRCTLCGKWFAESGNLKKHQRVHTGEKPFSCTHCGRRFAWIRNLKTHQQRNHM